MGGTELENERSVMAGKKKDWNCSEKSEQKIGGNGEKKKSSIRWGKGGPRPPAC